MPLNIELLLGSQTDTVDIYLCPQSPSKEGNEVNVGWNAPPTIPPSLGWGYGTQQHFVEYYHQEITYTYDLSNDAQRAFRRHHMKDIVDGSLLIISYDEETLPTHRMPCVDDINAKVEIKRIGYRISNRVFVHIDIEVGSNKSYVYVRYHHAENADTKKISSDIQMAISKLRKFMPRQ